MNRKVITVIVLIIVAALVMLAMIYAPSITEILQNLHSGPLPQH